MGVDAKSAELYLACMHCYYARNYCLCLLIEICTGLFTLLYWINFAVDLLLQEGAFEVFNSCSLLFLVIENYFAVPCLCELLGFCSDA